MRKIYAFLVLCLTTLAVSAQTYHNGTWYSYYDDAEHVMNTQGDYATGGIFAPTAGVLNVQWGYEWIDWVGAFSKIDTEIMESADNGSTTSIVGKLAENTGNNSNTSESFNVSANINWIKYNRSGLPTHKVHVYHFDLPLAKHILLASGTYGKSTDSHDFDTIEVDAVSEAYTVNLRSFYTDGDIFVYSSDPQNFRIGDVENTEGLTYEVGANACASANGKAAAAQGSTLGNIANYAFPIYFTPKKGGDFEATITITDGTSTATITVTGVAPKKEQAITWNEEQTALLTNGSIATATASSGLEVSYTFAPEGVVSYTDGAFVILSEGDVQITANQAGNDIYHAAEPVAKTFSIYAAEVLDARSADICEGSFYDDSHFGNLVEAGVYTDTLNTIHGGDSIISLTLAVHPLFSFEEELSFTTGEQHSWQGIDLGEFGVCDTTLVKEYQSVYGCDSIYTLHLTVKPFIITYGADTIHACSGETVIYEGKSYRQSATDSIVLSGRNYAGGDSIVVLVVSFSQPFSAESYLTITKGDEETWQGVDLSTIEVGDTTLVAEYTSIYGCDSIYTLHLTVEPLIITYGADTIYACSGETVTYEGKSYTQSATDTIVLSGRNYAGGDSIVVLVVSFSQPFSAESYLTITKGDEETWQGIDLSTIRVGDTTLVAEYKSVYGCDSIYVLNLTVEEKKEEAIPFTEADQVGVQKVLYQGNIYIRKGDELFDIRGIKVEVEK